MGPRKGREVDERYWVLKAACVSAEVTGWTVRRGLDGKKQRREESDMKQEGVDDDEQESKGEGENDERKKDLR